LPIINLSTTVKPTKEPMMKRRNFLSLSAVAATFLLLPTESKAATTTYSGPLWVFVHASGGWDPTSLCDPKGSDLTAPNGTPMNRTFASTDIVQVANTDIKYVPLSENQDGSGYQFSSFFEKYAKDLLVLNGIDAQTNGHSTGRRYTFSGNLSQETTSINALFSAALLPSSPLSFITFGGYDFTGGIIPAVRLNNSSIVDKLAEPNLFNNNSNTPFYSDATLEMINSSNAARSSDLAGSQPLASVRNALSRYNESHKQKAQIKDFQLILEELKDVDQPSTSMGREARLGIASFRAGLTASITLDSGGFDTHSNHDDNHIRRLAQLLRGADEVIQEAKDQLVSDRIVLVMGSEFGRTPGYNSGNGKDHWPVNSMMLMGTGIKGGRVIGASTDQHSGMAVDQFSLEPVQSGGINITAAHINRALRKLAGIDNDPLVTQTFPINAEDLALFS
jgi:hypothetical protein